MKFYSSILVLLFYFVIIEAQNKTYYVEYGKTINLQCITGSTKINPDTSFEWIGPRDQYMGGNINVIVPNFSYDNQGLYTCKITQMVNGEPVNAKKSIFVRIKGRRGERTDLFDVMVPKTFETFNDGIIFLNCMASKGASTDYTYNWITPYGETVSSPSFFKNGVSPSNAGIYSCQVKRKSDSKMVQAKTRVTIKELPIKILITSGKMTIGNNITLKCEVDKSKTLTKVYNQFYYEWFNSKNQSIVKNKILDIRLKDASNFGLYHCEISSITKENPYKQRKSFEIIYKSNMNSSPAKKLIDEKLTRSVFGGRSMNIQPKLTVTFDSQPPKVRFYESFQLTCQATPTNPSISYKIMLNNKTISTTNKFVIPRLEKKHLGTYQCNVKSQEARAGRPISLKAIYSLQPEYKSNSKIELEVSPGPQLFVRPKDKRELHCEVNPETGLGGRDAIWYFNGNEIIKDDYKKYKINIIPRLYVSMLVIRNIQMINDGKYECKVKDTLKEAYILVMTKDKHIEVNPFNETRNVSDGRAVEFHCRVDGYVSKNTELIWKFKSKENEEIKPIDSRWERMDGDTADETSFIVLPQAEVNDTGTYICIEPVTNNQAIAYLTVFDDLKMVVTPPIIRLRTGQTAKFMCYIENPGRSSSIPDFFMKNGGRAADNSRTNVSKIGTGKVELTFQSVTTNDNGTIFTCRHGRSTADVLVLVAPTCSPGFRLCKNEECLNSAKFCDGKKDCKDGSDEDEKFCKQCNALSKRCETHNGEPPSNVIYHAHWACDGEDDCGNGFDESKCFGNVLLCGGMKYQCLNESRSIPKAFMCDKDKDCTNGDDEENCVVPAIMSEQSNSYKVEGRKGETIVLRCEVTGNPLPKVIWRYNWGCLPDELRMNITDSYKNCEASISTLTISNFQAGDDGIYNCQGLSGENDAWSKDYQLFLIS